MPSPAPHASIPGPEQLVSSGIQLFSLPEVCIRINDMVDDPRCSAGDIGEVIRRDAALTTRLLKIVNSAFYGFPSRIDTITRAVTVVGVRDLRDLVLATSAMDVFARIPSELIDMARFWQHNLYTGVLSRLLATRCNVLHTERLFVGGLLHDVGKLVLYNRLPEVARDILLVAKGDDSLQAEAERDILGYTHADVGAALLGMWHLPKPLIEMVRYHHATQTAGDYYLDAALVAVADAVAYAGPGSVTPEDAIARLPFKAFEQTGLNTDVIEPVLKDAAVQFREACGILLPPNWR